jgi:hypothetical protein
MMKSPVDAREPASENATWKTAAGHGALLALLGILAVGFILRWWHVQDPLQQDEFGPLYAISQRPNTAPGYLPPASSVLASVQSWQDVSPRSVLPYGIANPLPLYHYLLFAVIQVLPIAEWSLRLPSVIAGLGCIAGVYVLLRRLVGVKVALVGALLTALDPMQIAVSVIARPYAIANLACVASFLFLLLIRHVRRRWEPVLGCLGYGVALALIGYLNPVLLLVGIAHLGLVIYFVVAQLRTGSPWAAFHWPLWWFAGCGLTALLLWPELGYMAEVRRFSQQHSAYLFQLDPLSELWPLTLLIHNSTLVVACCVLVVARRVARWRDGQGPKVQAPAAPTPQRKDGELLWLGWIWLILPQTIAIILVVAARQPIMLSRYLSYTTLGGSILLAYWATRREFNGVFVGLMASLAAAMVVCGLTEVGAPLNTGGAGAKSQVEELDVLGRNSRWRDGDILLYRPGFLEGDLLPNKMVSEDPTQLQRVLIAPISSIYAPQTPTPFLCLSVSHCYSANVKTLAGELYPTMDFYNNTLVHQLKSYRRYWVSSHYGDRTAFLACFLSWLANALDSDLEVESVGLPTEIQFHVAREDDPAQLIPDLSRLGSSERTPLLLVTCQQSRASAPRE